MSLKAALLDAGDIALGIVVGSNIANVLLILGLAALVRPLRVHAQIIRIDIPIMIGVSLLALPVLMNDRVGRVEGLSSLRLLQWWISRAITPLPTPVSPVRSTVARVGATVLAISSATAIASLSELVQQSDSCPRSAGPPTFLRGMRTKPCCLRMIAQARHWTG